MLSKWQILMIVYPVAAAIREMLNANKFCDLAEDSSLCYIKENLASLPHSPNQLAVNRVTNTLYFSFDSGQGEYIPATLNIDTKRLTVLKGVKDAFAIASDPSKDEIYFGGNHGIYRYNPILKTLNRLGVSNLDIWWLQIKTNVYFIKFPSLRVYFYENKMIKPVGQLKNSTVNQFVIDSNSDIFFVNNTGLFGVKNGENKVILIKDEPRFLSIAVDNNGTVHLCNEDGIYVISKIVQKVKKIINVQGVLGMTFDKNNDIIYSDSRNIVRLKPYLKDFYINTYNK